MTTEGTLSQVLAGEARWCVVEGDCLDVMATMPDGCADHVVTDPPYSRHVHTSVRSGKRRCLPDIDEHACRVRRVEDLKFEHLRPHVRRGVAKHAARLVRRWFAAFSDAESSWLWRLSCVAAGLDYVKTAEWERLGGAPQFSGDRPAQSFEAITLCHRPGRKRWNGGGKRGVYSHPIVANRLGQRGSRFYEAQKPEPLMMDLVSDFTDNDELILDPFAGSGTTGAAALRLGRRVILIEQKPDAAEICRERLRAEEAGSTLAARQAGQITLFGETG